MEQPVSEAVRQAREPGCAVQAELHAFVMETVIGLVRILARRLHVEDIGAAYGEPGFLGEGPGEGQCSAARKSRFKSYLLKWLASSC